MIAKDKGRLRRICRNYEQVENYEKAIADEENKWELHHRREVDEMKSPKQLQDEGRYFYVNPSELIFLTKSEHTKLHKENALPESRKKMSDAKKREKHPMFGKQHTAETRKKMSDAQKGENNPMFGKQHTAETRKKMSENHANMKGEKNPSFGKHWWNDGKRNIFSKDCPGEDFVRGVLKFNK